MSGRWNYRLMRHTDRDGGAWLALHEVHYDEAGRPSTWTEEEATPGGKSLDDVRADLRYMLEALDLPVLDYDENG